MHINTCPLEQVFCSIVGVVGICSPSPPLPAFLQSLYAHDISSGNSPSLKTNCFSGYQHAYGGYSLRRCQNENMRRLSPTVVVQVVYHQGDMIASPLVSIAIFLPLTVHSASQINVFSTPESLYQTKSALSDSPPSLPVCQLLSFSVCESHPPTFSTLRSRMSLWPSLGSSGDGQARILARSSVTVELIMLIVFKEPILWLKGCDTSGSLLLNILYCTCRWWMLVGN